MKQTAGIHHISAIVRDAQETVDFYAGVLGMRLVKKTVNFDDPETYHLYFGNEEGKPGTIITFFPWQQAYKGRIGAGQVGVTSYAIPQGSIAFWEKRLLQFGIKFEKKIRFGEEILAFDDPSGLKLELVERSEGAKSQWTFGGVDAQHAIKGFGGAVLLSAKPDATMNLLERVLGLKRIGKEENYVRFRAMGEIGNMIDVSQTVIDKGRMGTGTVHHLAWRADDHADHLDWRNHIREHGYGITDIIDRQYFDALYFREDGGVLFEIATDPPGFSHDESLETMGNHLMLPPWLEKQRHYLEKTLPSLSVRVLKEKI